MNNYKIHGSVEKDFTMVPKSIIRDTSISSEARIILEFLIDLTGDFNVNERGLTSILGISISKVKRAVIELEDAGYIQRQKSRNEASQFIGWFWDISATPKFLSDNPTVENTDIGENRHRKNLPSEKPESENRPVGKPTVGKSTVYNIPKGYKTNNPKPNEEKTNGDKTEGREFTPTLTPLIQSGESVISSGEVNVNQAFNRFCEVYPNLGDRNTARAAFFAIPDIDKICWQIANSVEWFMKTKRWDDWQTGQKNVVCPQATKFLKRGDWQQFLKSGATISKSERRLAILSQESKNYEING